MSSKEEAELSGVAARIIEKCGGVEATAKLSECSPNWVYRWRMKRSAGGTGGHIPASAQRKLMEAAAKKKCKLSPSDFFDLDEGEAA